MFESKLKTLIKILVKLKHLNLKKNKILKDSVEISNFADFSFQLL